MEVTVFIIIALLVIAGVSANRSGADPNEHTKPLRGLKVGDDECVPTMLREGQLPIAIVTAADADPSGCYGYD